mmetsp:Transcript_8431/g.12458  ORF Transcript_8431/g.12458 Transcript_8431/m.12458 type:complete len:1041 (-) Transcript_8431:1706-4828(-)
MDDSKILSESIISSNPTSKLADMSIQKRNRPQKNEYYIKRAQEVLEQKQKRKEKDRMYSKEDKEKMENMQMKYKINWCGKYKGDEETEFLRYYYSKKLIRQRLTILAFSLIILALTISEIIVYVTEGTGHVGFLIGRGVLLLCYLIICGLMLVPFINRLPYIIELQCITATLLYLLYQYIKSASDGVNASIANVILVTLIVVFQLRLYGNLIIVFSAFLFYVIVYLIMRPNWWISSLTVYIYTSTTLVIGLLSTGMVLLMEHNSRKLFVKKKNLSINREIIDSKMIESEAILQSLIPKWFIQKATSATTGFYQEYENSTVLFIEGLNTSKKMSDLTRDILAASNKFEVELDRVTRELSVEKLKSVGNYHIILATGESGAIRLSFLAQHMRRVVDRLNDSYYIKMHFRMGISQGPLIICLLGTYNLTFEAFGSVIREAFSIQQAEKPSTIIVSKSVYEATNHFFDYFEKKGNYVLTSLKEPCSLSQFIKNNSDSTSTCLPKTSFKNLPPVISYLNLEQFLHERTPSNDSSFVDMIDMAMYKKFVANPHSTFFVNNQREVVPTLNYFFLTFRPYKFQLQHFFEKKGNALFLIIGIFLCISQIYMLMQTIYLFYLMPTQIYKDLMYIYATLALSTAIYTSLFYLSSKKLYSRVICFIFVLYLLISVFISFYCAAFIWDVELSFQEMILFEVIMLNFIIFMPFLPYVLKVILQDVVLLPSFFAIRWYRRGKFNLYDTVLFFGKMLISVYITWLFHYDLAQKFKRRLQLKRETESLSLQIKKNKLLLRSALPTFLLKNLKILDKIKSNNQLEMKAAPVTSNSSDELSDVISSPYTSNDETELDEDNEYYHHMAGKQACMVVTLLELDENNLESVKFVNDIYAWFDLAGESLGCEKIHSVGFQYYCTSTKVSNLGDCALVFSELVDIVSSIYFPINDISYSIGIHYGKISNIAFGYEKLKYDLWGPAISHARALANLEKKGKILISEKFAEKLPKDFHYSKLSRASTPNLGQSFYYLVSFDRDTDVDQIHLQKQVISTLSRPVSNM